MRVMSPAVARIEEIALAWMLELLGFPANCGGGFVTGTTAANFSALAAARSALLARRGWDVEEVGLFGAPEIRVIVGDEVHASMLKALSLVGFGRSRVTRFPADDQAGGSRLFARARCWCVGARRRSFRALGRTFTGIRSSRCGCGFSGFVGDRLP